ncbi:hypothetical protein KAF25_005481 [Fusarium avenaceum]|uniref:Uncharacterized protein n=1 Tax=Fusarium avenaceum TaxID=40199 RepID=A0A9P7H321_9HYPO|nr:hypothetical protein KAF25_005481 [Fusarium avenaceum]
MHSVHTITDYQTTSTGTTPMLSGFPSLDSAHDIIFRPVQANETMRGSSVQSAEEIYHSPFPGGPSRLTRVALSALAAGASSAATTYSQAVIYREMFTHHQSKQSTADVTEQPTQIVEPSTPTFNDALNDQHGAAVETDGTELDVPASISSVPNSNPDQTTETTQGNTGSLEDGILSTSPLQNEGLAKSMDASQQNVTQQSQTTATTSSTPSNAGTHQKPVPRGNIEQSLLDLKPGAESRGLAALEHRRLGFGSHVLFDFRNTVSGQAFTVPLPIVHGMCVDNYAWLHSASISENPYGLRDSILKITPH